jgi:hypothetical protein
VSTWIAAVHDYQQVVLDNASRKYCDACLPARRAAVVANFASARPAVLAKRRVEGTDPAHTVEARHKQGLRAGENARANAEWDRLNPGQTIDLNFTRDILPGLQRLPLATIMKSTGLSLRYCSLVRRGLKTPHSRHWAALSNVAKLAPADQVAKLTE